MPREQLSKSALGTREAVPSELSKLRQYRGRWIVPRGQLGFSVHVEQLCETLLRSIRKMYFRRPEACCYEAHRHAVRTSLRPLEHSTRFTRTLPAHDVFTFPSKI
jgi:hypothetical protein